MTQALFSGAELAVAILNSEWVDGIMPEEQFSLNTDSRKIGDGEAFLALCGENFDGHKFVASVVAQGAVAVVVNQSQVPMVKEVCQLPILAVPDTLIAYQQAANFHRRRFPNLKVMAVTGSVGKTSVKEMMRVIAEEAAGGVDRVLYTIGNTNNQIGVAQNLLRLTPDHQVAVIEMGTNHHGEIRPLTMMAEPQIAVVNNIGACHLEFLGSLEGVAQEKGTIYCGLPEQGAVAIMPETCVGKEELLKFATGHQVVCFGHEKSGAEVTGRYVSGDLDRSVVELFWRSNGKLVRFEWGLTGEHQAVNAAAAAAAGSALGLTPEVIARALTRTELPGMRMKQYRDRNQVLWVNDAYNANPDSMRAAIRQCAGIFTAERAGELVLVLGDMLELGSDENKLHKEILTYAREVLPKAMLVAVGERMVRNLPDNASGDTRLIGVNSSIEANGVLQRLLKPGMTVFLKASRGTRLELVMPEEHEPTLKVSKIAELLGKLTVNVVGDLKRADELLNIGRITNDSRLVAPGTVFVAIRGSGCDGNVYRMAALQAGARLLVSSALPLEDVPEEVCQIQVNDDYYAYSLLMQYYYDFPDRDLEIRAVTGTNGKTTTALAWHRIFGGQDGLLSTIKYVWGKNLSVEAERTTPEAGELFAALAMMRRLGLKRVFMEASSHALEQHRLGNLKLECGIFTNLTGDHLDYHLNMENYLAAKVRLFDEYLKPDAKAWLNWDGVGAEAMYEALQGSVASERIRTFGRKVGAQIPIEVIESSGAGFKIRIQNHEYNSNLIGDYNISNIAGVILSSLDAGLTPEAIQKGLDALVVPGRLEAVKTRKGVIAVVDYAHTDDALSNVLHAVRQVVPEGGRLIVVFGCGGDRDRSKRPRMGRVASELADLVIVTSDNPRTEEPEAIIHEILAGIPGNLLRDDHKVRVEPDRRQALQLALDLADKLDVIVAAGKGHENYQEINKVKYHFDDREELAK